MLTRRTFAVLPLLPFAVGPVNRLDIEDKRHEPLDVGRTTILSISPDGSTLAGVQYRNRLCFLDATSLEVLQAGEEMAEFQLIDRTSVHWSPDGKHIAFSLDSWRLMRDSDIYIADVATATIINLTAEGHDDESASLIDIPEVNLDVYPRWIDDSTVLFARHGSLAETRATCELCTIDMTTQDVTTLVPLHESGYGYVISPPVLMADNRLMMTVQGGAQPTEIVMVDPDGTVTPVVIEGVRAPQLIHATDTQALVWDVEGYATWLVLLDGSGERLPFADVFDYGDGYEFVGRPTIAADPVAYAGVALSASSEKHRVFTMIDGERRDQGHLGGDVRYPVCHFAGNTLLIAEEGNAWLIDLQG